MVCTKGDLFCTIPTNMTPESFISGETQVVEVVSDELQAPKANCFTWDEPNTGQVVVVGNEGEF
jgi:hypothetical protein